MEIEIKRKVCTNVDLGRGFKFVICACYTVCTRFFLTGVERPFFLPQANPTKTYKNGNFALNSHHSLLQALLFSAQFPKPHIKNPLLPLKFKPENPNLEGKNASQNSSISP